MKLLLRYFIFQLSPENIEVTLRALDSSLMSLFIPLRVQSLLHHPGFDRRLPNFQNHVRVRGPISVHGLEIFATNHVSSQRHRGVRGNARLQGILLTLLSSENRQDRQRDLGSKIRVRRIAQQEPFGNVCAGVCDLCTVQRDCDCADEIMCAHHIVIEAFHIQLTLWSSYVEEEMFVP